MSTNVLEGEPMKNNVFTIPLIVLFVCNIYLIVCQPLTDSPGAKVFQLFLIIAFFYVLQKWFKTIRHKK